MIAVDQNIIILIDIKNPENSRPYSSFVKLCKSNPNFPLYELYKRKRYEFPFKKTINGIEYLFIRCKVNSATDNFMLTNDIMLLSGFKKLKKNKYEFGDFYVDITKVKHSAKLKQLFKAVKGIELDIIIN